MSLKVAEQSNTILTFREDLAQARFWYHQAKSKQAKIAINKLIYAIIVMYHKDMSNQEEL
jgi:hypothetical protein